MTEPLEIFMPIPDDWDRIGAQAPIPGQETHRVRAERVRRLPAGKIEVRWLWLSGCAAGRNAFAERFDLSRKDDRCRFKDLILSIWPEPPADLIPLHELAGKEIDVVAIPQRSEKRTRWMVLHHLPAAGPELAREMS